MNTFYQETFNRYIIDSCFNIYHKGISSDFTCIILELLSVHINSLTTHFVWTFLKSLRVIYMTSQWPMYIVFGMFISIKCKYIFLITKKILLWCGGNINKTMHVSDERLFWGDTADGRGKSKSNVYLCFSWVHI